MKDFFHVPLISATWKTSFMLHWSVQHETSLMFDYHATKTSFMYTIMQLKPLSCYTDDCKMKDHFHVHWSVQHERPLSCWHFSAHERPLSCYTDQCNMKTSFMYTIMRLIPLSCTLILQLKPLSCRTDNATWKTSFMLHWLVQHERLLSCYTD